MKKKLFILGFVLMTMSACDSKKEVKIEANIKETKVSTTEVNSETKETTEKSMSSTEEKVKPNSRDNSNFDDNVKSFKEDLDHSVNEIWYFTNGDIAKDEEIDTYLVFNDKKVSIYKLNKKSEKKTLGELSKMKDEDILSYVKSEREKVDVKSYQEKSNLLFSTKPVPYKLSIKTDATGNKTIAEQISADFETDSDGDGVLFHYNFTMNSLMYQIYEQEYLGFEVGFKWDDPWKEDYRTRMLRKKKSENDLILIDEPTTEGIEVDGN